MPMYMASPPNCRKAAHRAPARNRTRRTEDSSSCLQGTSRATDEESETDAGAPRFRCEGSLLPMGRTGQEVPLHRRRRGRTHPREARGNATRPSSTRGRLPRVIGLEHTYR
jgi:hypothetical protein